MCVAWYRDAEARLAPAIVSTSGAGADRPRDLDALKKAIQGGTCRGGPRELPHLLRDGAGAERIESTARREDHGPRGAALFDRGRGARAALGADR